MWTGFPIFSAKASSYPTPKDGVEHSAITRSESLSQPVS